VHLKIWHIHLLKDSAFDLPLLNPCTGNGFLQCLPASGGGGILFPHISWVLEHRATKFQWLSPYFLGQAIQWCHFRYHVTSTSTRNPRWWLLKWNVHIYIFRHIFLTIFIIYLSAILHSRWRLTLRNHANSTFRSGAHENMWFPKMYFRFPCRHANISSKDMTELYMAINSPRSPWWCPKSATYLSQIWRYGGKVDSWHFIPPHLPG